MNKIDIIRALDPKILMKQYQECGHSMSLLLRKHGIESSHNPARKYIRDLFLTKFGFKTSRSVQARMEAIGQEAIKEAIRTSTSISEVLKKIGIKDLRNNRMNFFTACKVLQVEVPKFSRKKCSVVNIWNCDKVLKDFSNSKIPLPSNSTLKRYYLEAVYPNANNCNVCNLSTTWENKPLVLQLDHIDGNKKNNLLSNLRLLCPNCHSQTDTYVRRNKHSYGGV